MTFCKYCNREYKDITSHYKTKKHLDNVNNFNKLIKIVKKKNKIINNKNNEIKKLKVKIKIKDDIDDEYINMICNKINNTKITD